jgi:hypothetical protein
VSDEIKKILGKKKVFVSGAIEKKILGKKNFVSGEIKNFWAKFFL